MKSTHLRLTVQIVLIIVIAVSVSTVVGVFSIRNLGKKDSYQMLLLMCETGAKNLNSYFDSVEQSVHTVSNLVDQDLEGLSDDQLEEHVDRMRIIFDKVANQTNGVLTYYYRIDPDYSDKVKGFWYTKLEGDKFTEHDVTDITQFDTDDTSKLVWFTVPKASGKAVWLPPYITDNLDVRVISYNVPVYCDDRFIGVIGIELDCSIMSKEVDNITLYDNGYAFITDDKGELVYHPVIDVAAMTDETRPRPPEGIPGNGKYMHYQYNGVEKLGAWRPLDNGMRFNVAVPVSEINGRWQDMIRISVVISVLFVLAVVAFHLWYVKKLLRADDKGME